VTDPNPTNVVVACIGRKGTGKSQLLHRLYTSKADRVLSIGTLPQDMARDPGAVVVLGLGPLLEMLKEVARWQASSPENRRWHIATEMERDDLKELFALLVPPLGVPNDRSLSVAFGGMALCINELYDVAPNQGTPDEITRAPRAGRHRLLDIFSAVQRPASCNRDFTAAADHVYLFAQSEGNDIDFVARSFGKRVAQLVASLTGHDFVHFDNATKTARHFSGHGRYLGTLSRGPAVEMMRPEMEREAGVAGQNPGA
jgi:hypothetical protein